MTDKSGLHRLLSSEPLPTDFDPTSLSAQNTGGARDGHAFGSGTGWLLVDSNVQVAEKTLPAGFASTEHPGFDRVSQCWEGGDFESGILWLHQTSEAGVLAVPTARWDGTGRFRFFLWRGVGPILEMPSWSGNPWWSGTPAGFDAARDAATAFGNAALGIGDQSA